MKLSPKFKIVAWLVSFAGLVWQLHLISDQYFRYPFVTEIIFEIPKILKSPTAFLKVEIPSQFWHRLNETITANEIFHHFPSAEEIHFPMYMHANTKVPKFIYNFVLIYKFSPFIQEIKHNIRKHFLNYVHVRRAAVNFTENEKTLLMVGDERSDGMEQSDYKLELDNEVLQFTIDYSLIQKLDPPYTKCFDYEKYSNSINSKRCLGKCRAERLVKETGMFPPEGMFEGNLSDNITVLIRGVWWKNETIRQIKRIVDYECHLKCERGDPCKEEFYNLNQFSSGNYNYHPFAGVTEIRLFSSERPHITSTYKPLISLIDFIVYILSTLSFWLGMAPLTLILRLSKLDKKSNTFSRKRTIRVGFEA